MVMVMDYGLWSWTMVMDYGLWTWSWTMVMVMDMGYWGSTQDQLLRDRFLWTWRLDLHPWTLAGLSPSNRCDFITLLSHQL